MNREKHESSLLEVFSDVGPTPTASTISSIFKNALSAPAKGHLDRKTIDSHSILHVV